MRVWQSYPSFNLQSYQWRPWPRWRVVVSEQVPALLPQELWVFEQLLVLAVLVQQPVERQPRSEELLGLGQELEQGLEPVQLAELVASPFSLQIRQLVVVFS